MGSSSKRKLDVAAVDAALQRAARRAVRGTRAERSGRFLPVKGTGTSNLRNESRRKV